MTQDSHGPKGRRLALLSLTALGVVYGDIGTSPLYAIRECFHGVHALSPTPENVLGVLSLIFWSLTLVITVKYLCYVTRADNHGEGGILALMALVRTGAGARRRIVLLLGLFGAALLYGDGMLTPAISVLSAVEGLEVAAPGLSSYVVPLTMVILAVLFLFQKHGTARVGSVFGPLMVLWFTAIGLLGISSIVQEPRILAALDPRFGYSFFLRNGFSGYFILGAVFLVVTGGEALYADLGHFSRRPILMSWFALAGPGLVLNYFGQGALLLRNPSAAHNPFYRLAPSWALLPLVLLATVATVIASQAVITGVFSLTQQAVRLGYAPRMTVVHTSPDERGQIYVPAANWGLLVSTLVLVAVFGRSSGLAAAYGIAVSLTMIITTLLSYQISRQRWGWGFTAALSVTALFFIVDLAFFGANIVKFGRGGWIPLTIAGGITLLFLTWRKGQDALGAKQRRESLPMAHFIEEVPGSGIARVPGQAVFLCSSPGLVPSALLHNIKHNKVLHARNFLVTVAVQEVPRVPARERLEIMELGAGFTQLVVRCGFMEDPDLLATLYRANEEGLDIDPLMASYIISRNTIVQGVYGGMKGLDGGLFRLMFRNALRPALFFRLPPNRVVEIGRQIQL